MILLYTHIRILEKRFLKCPSQGFWMLKWLFCKWIFNSSISFVFLWPFFVWCCDHCLWLGLVWLGFGLCWLWLGLALGWAGFGLGWLWVWLALAWVRLAWLCAGFVLALAWVGFALAWVVLCFSLGPWAWSVSVGHPVCGSPFVSLYVPWLYPCLWVTLSSGNCNSVKCEKS